MKYDEALLLVTSAASFAAEAHKGQQRKELGEPYILHPVRVAQRAATLGFDAPFIAACYLHDVVEDCAVAPRTLENAFPEFTVKLVVAMTKWWDDGDALPSDVKEANYKTYYTNLVTTPGGINLKFLDRADNLNDFARMARLTPKAHRWASNYLRKTERQFAELYAQGSHHLHHGAKTLYDMALETLRVEVRE